jgi:hypothetical protein
MTAIWLIRFVAIFISIVVSKIAAAENLMRDFYIHIRKESIAVGEYQKGTLKAVPFKIYPIGSINSEEIKQYFFDDGEENILYYVHCWLGNIDFYNKGAIKKLELLHRVNKMIAVKWESRGIFYRANWYNAQNEGGKIASLFADLLGVSNKNNVLLCHSMGHSVLLGMVKKLEPHRKYFKLIFFAGADLPADMLNDELKGIIALSDQTIIYTHQRDRMLQISGWLHQKKRLGMLPPESSVHYSSINALTITDVTNWPGNHSKSPANHIYFKDHNGVREDMNAWLNGALPPA